MDKDTKRIKAQRARQEEAVLNRIMAWLAGGAVLEFLLLLLNRRYSYADTWTVMRMTVKVVAVAGLVCALLGLVWLRVAKKNGAASMAPMVCTLFSAGLGGSCLATWMLGRAGLRFAYIALPVFIVLVLVYYLYQREFFLQACGALLALLGVWMAGSETGSSLKALLYTYTAAAALLLLAGVALCRKAQGDRGKVPFRDGKVRLVAKDANYALLYAGAAVDLLVLVLALAPVPTLALCGVAVAWLLIMAVYYTVKLM